MNVFGLLDCADRSGRGGEGKHRLFRASGHPIAPDRFRRDALVPRQSLERGPIQNWRSTIATSTPIAPTGCRACSVRSPLQGDSTSVIGPGNSMSSPLSGTGRPISTTRFWAPTAFVQQAVAARLRIPVVRVPHCIRDRQVPSRRPGVLPSAARPPGHPLHVRPRQLCRSQEPAVGHRGGRSRLHRRPRSVVGDQGLQIGSRSRTGQPPSQESQTCRVSDHRRLARPATDAEPDRCVRHVSCRCTDRRDSG